jgi:MFS transporter, PHS family, inorganic phosphate transporter
MISGVFSTMLIPETKGISLEELSRERQDDFILGIAQERKRPMSDADSAI